MRRLPGLVLILVHALPWAPLAPNIFFFFFRRFSEIAAFQNSHGKKIAAFQNPGEFSVQGEVIYQPRLSKDGFKHAAKPTNDMLIIFSSVGPTSGFEAGGGHESCPDVAILMEKSMMGHGTILKDHEEFPFHS